MSMTLNRPNVDNFEVGCYPDPEYYDTVELKYDGIFGQIVLEGDRWEIWSRNGLLKRSGELTFSIGRTILYSEYLYASEWSKDRPELYDKLAVFGATLIEGEDVTSFTNTEVRDCIELLLEAHEEDPFFQRMFLVTQWDLNEAPKIWENKVVAEQYEGLIFKKSDQPWLYGFGRMKQVASMDYVFLGVDESDSDTYAGWGIASIQGGLFVDGKLRQVCRVSGLTNEWRKELYDNTAKYIGKVFEATGKKISKRGALRHPNFLRFREDKNPEDCKWLVS